MIKKKIHARERREDMLYKRVTRTRAHLLPGQVSQRELRATVAMQDIQESQRRARFKGSKRNGPLFAFCKKRTRASNFARPNNFVAVDLTIRPLGFRHYIAHTRQQFVRKSFRDAR